ncbi:MAG: PAS domain S-box protein, partial [Chloroflexota bacterium]|nr:PAS domain S-box protein [Chloroflexota bacterium]
MFVYNLETLEISQVNGAAVQLYGYSEDEFQGLTVDKLGVAEKGFFSFISNGDTGIDLFDSQELRHMSKGGEVFSVKITHQDVPDEDGQATNSRLVVVHDIARRDSDRQYQKAFNQLDALVRNSPQAMVVWDENFRIKEWSSHAEVMTGYTKEEVEGKTPYIFDFHDLKDIFRVSEKIQGIVGGRVDSDQIETKIYTKDRSVISIKVHASAIRDEKGRLISVLTFIEDLTRHKKIEARYEQLFEGASDGICIVKGNEIVDCNAQLEKIFGADKKDIIGKTPFDFSPETQPDGADSNKKGFNKIKLALQGAPQVFEWKHKTLDGELVDSEVRLNRIEINEEMHVQAMVSDLTRQKEIERKIALRGEMFTELFNNSPIGIVMMDSENKVTMANSAFEEMFGFTIDELKGKNVDDLIVTKELKKEAEDITDSTQHGQQFNIESIRVRKDGTPLDVIIGGVPVYSGGSQVAIYGMYVDITERKSSEKLLQHSLKEKEILLAEVHHRVKNNLAIVSGLLQLQTFNVEEDEQLKKHLQDSQLRIHSMAIVHEMLYQSETLSEISVGPYMAKLAEVVSGTLKS